MSFNLDELDFPGPSFPNAPPIFVDTAEQTDDEVASMPEEDILPSFEIWCDNVISQYEQNLMERNEELEKAMEDAGQLVNEYNLLRESRKRGKRTPGNPENVISTEELNNVILNVKPELSDHMEF